MYENIALIFPKHVFSNSGGLFLPHPIGLEYIAASVEDVVESISIFDENCEELDYRELDALGPSLIGITMHSYQYRYVIRLASRLKEELSSEPAIVVGGFHPTLMPEEVLKNECIDFAVRGEGEQTFRELVMGKDLESIPGLSYRKSGRIVHNPSRPFIQDLDKLPFPARHLRRHPEKYTFLGFRYASMMTSRGCVANCHFCNAYNMHKGVWRSRSVENIIEEIEFLQKRYKPRMFFFWDLDFMADRRRLEEFCEMIRERGIDIRFICMARADSVLNCRDILGGLRESGLTLVQVGLERPDDASLVELNKRITVSMSGECVKALREAGIFSYTFFVVGLPGDRKDIFLKCNSYANNLGLDFWDFLDPLPLPETPFRKEMEEKGFLRTKSWDNLYFLTNSNLKMRHMSFEEFDYYMNKYKLCCIKTPRGFLKALRWFFNTFRPGLLELPKSAYMIGKALRSGSTEQQL